MLGYFVVVVVLLAILIAASLWDDTLIVLLLTALLPLASKSVKHWRARRLSVLRGYCTGLSTRFSLTDGDVLLQIQDLRLRACIMDWIFSMFVVKPLQCSMHGVTLQASLRLCSSREESMHESDTPKSRSSILWFSRLCSVTVNNMEVKLDLVDVAASVQFTLSRILVRGSENVFKPEKCCFGIESDTFEVCVSDSAHHADTPPHLRFICAKPHLQVELGLHSNDTAFSIEEQGPCSVDTSPRPMLQIYERYSTLEDAILAYTDGASGRKLKAMNMRACLGILNVRIRDEQFSDSFRFCFVNFMFNHATVSTKFEKSQTLSVAAESMTTVIEGQAEGSAFTKVETLKVNRSQISPFRRPQLDSEHMDITVNRIEMVLDREYLDWHFFFQLLLNWLPSSRFASAKTSVMTVNCERVYVHVHGCNKSDDSLSNPSFTFGANMSTLKRTSEPRSRGTDLNFSCNDAYWRITDTATSLKHYYSALDPIDHSTLTLVRLSTFQRLGCSFLLGDRSVLTSCVFDKCARADPQTRLVDAEFENVSVDVTSETFLHLIHCFRRSLSFVDEISAIREALHCKFSPVSSFKPSQAVPTGGTQYHFKELRFNFAVHQDFNISLLASCFSSSVRDNSTQFNAQTLNILANDYPIPIICLEQLTASRLAEVNINMWNVVLGKFAFSPCTSGGVGILADYLLNCKSAFDQCFSSSADLVENNRIPPCLNFECPCVSLNILTETQGESSPLLTITISETCLTVDGRRDHSTATEEEIRALDQCGGPKNFVNIQGGAVLLKATVIKVFCSDCPTAFVSLDEVQITGGAFLAVASDKRIRNHSKNVILFLKSATDEKVENYQVTIYSTDAPVKLYTDLLFRTTRCDVRYEDKVAQTMDSIVDALGSLLPPKQDLSPPLDWWDTIRYWVHGKCSGDMDSLLVSSSHQRGNKTFQIALSAKTLRIKSVKSIIELSLDTFVVTSPSIGHEELNHQWFYIPRLVVSLAHIWHSSGLFDHHSYLGHEPILDKFQTFRASTANLSLDVSLESNDVESVHMGLRLDLMAVAARVFLGETEASKACVPTDCGPNLSNIISAFAINVSIGRYMAATWCSSKDYVAFVFKCKSMNMVFSCLGDERIPSKRRVSFVERSVLGLQEVDGSIQDSSIMIENLRPYYVRAVLDLSTPNFLGRMFDSYDASMSELSRLSHAKDVHVRYATESLASDHSSKHSMFGLSENILQESSLSESFTPSLGTFELNHYMLRPPSSCIPNTNRRWSPFTCSSSSSPRSSPLTQIATSENKVWYLTVNDLHMLWTLHLRDGLFHFVTQCMGFRSVFANTSQQETDIVSPRVRKSIAVSRSSKVSASLLDELYNSNSSFGLPSNTVQLQMTSRRRRGSVVNMDLANKAKISRVESSRISLHQASVDSRESQSPYEVNEVKFQFFFQARLERTQVNFLCEKTHSSLVISASRASVDGRKHSRPLIYRNEEVPQTKTDITLRMENVAAYAVCTNANCRTNDGEAGDRVYWCTASPETETGPCLFELHEVVKKFRFAASYTFFIAGDKHEGDESIFSCDEDLTCLFLLDLHTLSIDLTSEEFFIVLNAVRNVLLAPPPISEQERAQKKHESMVNLTLSAHSVHSADQPKLDLDTRKTRDEIKKTIEANMATYLRDQPSLTREVQYFIGRGTWILRDTDHNQRLEVGFFGLHGHHLFKSDNSISLYFDLQRFWCRNLHPGPEAMNTFQDPHSVLTPLLDEVSRCERCESELDPRTSELDECKFHAHPDGTPGEFVFLKQSSVPDETRRLMSPRRRRQQGEWTCCHKTSERDLGCVQRPHVCKERMLTILAEALPTALVQNIELTVLQHLEINIFPGTSYKLQLQITKRLADMLHEYFAVPREETETSLDKPNIENSIAISESSLLDYEEAVYFKYLRVGDIVVQFSTAGFAVNANGIITAVTASVPAYVRQRRVTTWPEFLIKLEQHSMWSLAKSTASSITSRFKLKLGRPQRWTGRRESNSYTADEDAISAKEEDEKKKADLLLGRR